MNCSSWGLLIELLSGAAHKVQKQDFLCTIHTHFHCLDRTELFRCLLLQWGSTKELQLLNEKESFRPIDPQGKLIFFSTFPKDTKAQRGKVIVLKPCDMLRFSEFIRCCYYCSFGALNSIRNEKVTQPI